MADAVPPEAHFEEPCQVEHEVTGARILTRAPRSMLAAHVAQAKPWRSASGYDGLGDFIDFHSTAAP